MSQLFIHTAVLHIFDYANDLSVMSETSLNLEDPVTEGYIKKHLSRIIADIRMHRGVFEEDSKYLHVLQEYVNEACSFTEFSTRAVDLFKDELKKISARSYDILFVSYSDNDIPYTAMLFLDNKQEYTHHTTVRDGHITNGIMLQSSLLPSIGRRINSFVIINTLTMNIQYVDETDWGDTQNVMQDMILQCSGEKSRREVLEDVKEIISEVAVECDENPTLLLSKYKNYIHENTDETEMITAEDLAVHVFNDSDEMQNTFISKSLERELPREIQIPARTTGMTRQKIQTDTGIDITFPTRYSEDSEYIRFINHDDGTISIEIRNINRITNK